MSPAKRDWANFLIHARIKGIGPLPKHWEQIWARQVSDYIFEICCIPFFVYDFSLGDHVETTKEYVIKKVIKRSGHNTFRVSFLNSSYKGADEEVLIYVVDKLNCLVEWHSEVLLAIDAPTRKLTNQVANFLEAKSALGHLTFELAQTK